MRSKPVQMNFTNGEVAPRLYGRSDLAKYWASVETLENFVILPYGGVARRDGLQYVVAQGDEARKVRLIPFIFSTEQAYVIEAGHEYMRFLMNHGQIVGGLDSDTVLLLHMNGVDGSQTFTDETGTHTVTANTTAQIDTDKSKFGGASGLFTKLDLSYLRVPDSSDFDFSADDIFTIEVNLYQTALQTGVICSQYTDTNNKFRLMVWADGHVEFTVWHTGVTQSLSTAISKLTVDTWHHIRIVGDGTNYYLFVDGIKLVEAAITKSMQNYTGDLLIGTMTGIVAFYGGWMDELRISDAARSTADFVPPTQEYPIGGAAYEVATPYLESDLPLLKYFQSYDTMYIFHPDHEWMKLTRTGHAAWTLAEVDFTNGPWLDEETDIAFTPSATTGDIDLTSNADFFLDGHVGALLRLYNSTVWGYVKIATVADAQTATATVISELGSTADSTKYQEGAWSTVRGFPSSGAFNEASLVAVANDDQPQTIWASKKGDFENFDVGTGLDDEGFIYTIPASNRILWPGALRELVLGTGDGMYKMTGGIDDYISPTNVRVRPGMAIGAMDLSPIPVNNSLLYWQKGSRKLRELTYDPNSYDENYVAPDLSLLADHITLGGVKYSAWQQEPNSILWTVRADGVLLGMSYMRTEDIVGWGRHITDGEIESVAVIPDPTDSFNEVWVSVKRDIDTVDANTVLLLRMNGVDESTSFPDASAGTHTVTAVGTAQIDTAQSKFGGASGLFSGGNLTIPDSSDFDFSADDIFTIETWVRMNHVSSAAYGICAQQIDADNGFEFSVILDGAVEFKVGNAAVWQTLTTSTGVVTADSWHHIRIVGDGTNYYLFVDGILLVEEAITESMSNYTSLFYIGKKVDYFYMSGWLDYFKVSDLARSTTDFTPPEVEGITHRYIEFMNPDMMVDSGLIYSGGEVSSVSGLSHLEGETVNIVADGVVYAQQVVSSGAVAISPAASEIQIGLPYTSKIVTMKPVIPAKDGTTAGLPKKWAELFVSVYETSGLTINSGGSDEIIDFRKYSDVGLGEAIPLYTGDIRVSQLGWVDGRITLTHDDPLPCTILGIFGVLETGN